MTPAARVAAAITVLDAIAAGRSAEQALAAWGRASRFAGSGDRAALRDLVFDALRCRASAAALGGSADGRGLMLGLAVQQGWDIGAIFTGAGHAPAVPSPDEAAQLAAPPALEDWQEMDLPAWLWPVWQADLGADAERAARALRHRAALFLRANLRRGDVDSAIAALDRDGVTAVPHPDCAGCLEVTANPRRVAAAAAYRDGLVEVQDAASQIAVASLDIAPGTRVLDYCAGGGGKALALADRFDCRVVAHDVAMVRMQDIAPRADRAGVAVAVVDTAALASQAPFDVVVVDAPCSGSGTWRRNPEAKWALTADGLADFAALQDRVLAEAARYLAPGGTLVYMTCSVLRAENDAVTDRFCAAGKANPGGAALRLLPDDRHDGFYCRTLLCD